jgi:hypothetical protein
MGSFATLLCTVLVATDQAPAASAQDDAETAEEPTGGAGVSPIEIIPRVELRQSYVQMEGGLSVRDTTTEIDIQFLRRLLLRYEVPYRTIGSPDGQVSGVGDIELTGLGILTSSPRALLAILAGAVLDTASQPQLGTGKQQVFFGAGAAYKPRRWLLGYAVLLEKVSVAGQSARPDVNQLDARIGAIVFGRQYNWLKLDLDTLMDFQDDAGRLYGTLEVGSLVIGRVGLFARTGTQLLGTRQLDYSIAAGVRYLFRLETSRPAPH